MRSGNDLQASILIDFEYRKMDMELLKLGFQVGQFLLTAGVGFYVYMSNKDKVTNQRITALETGLDSRLDDHATRIARLEERVTHVPTHEDLGQMHEKMNTLSSGVQHMAGEFSAVKKLISTIHDYLLNGGKK